MSCFIVIIISTYVLGVKSLNDKKETWFLLDSGIEDAAINMAIDEALIHWHSKGDIGPTLRFYRWDKPSLTVGHFQNVAKTIDLAGIRKHDCHLVRRLTGGSAVLHDDELTYSIVVSESHPKIPRSINQAYFVLAQGILQGYRQLQIEADFSLPDLANRERSAVCFETPAIYEMIVDGKKLTGNAQTRKNGVLLQHGSIPFSFDADMLFDLFQFSSERLRKRQREHFLHKAISINDITGKEHDYETVRDAFHTGFKQTLNIDTETLHLTDKQWEYIHYLAETKYRSSDWNIERKSSIERGS